MNSFFARRFIVQGIMIAVALILLIRLFYMQVVDDRYVLYAQNNVFRPIKIYPARGAILDRNEKVLVQNEPVYDIMVTPREVKPFDTLKFCRLIGIDKAGFDERFKKAKAYSPNLASVFLKLISARDFAPIQEKLAEFPGFFKQSRTVRSYPDSIAAHFLGYVSEITPFALEKSNGYYKPGDIVGKAGVESAYEDLLRGQRGVKNVMVDARGRPKGIFAEGQYDTVAVAGDRLISSLDIRIQKLGEQLMRNKVGSVVAIEPSSGEILAYISSPTYDPNLMVGNQISKNFSRMNVDPYKPFLNRPVMGGYPPGSSFKPLDGLIALQEGLITPSTIFYCPGGYRAGSHTVKCEHVDGATDLRKAIKMSCNTYFCNAFEKLISKNGQKNTRGSFIDWRKRVVNFGLGGRLGIDLPSERKGNVPTDEHYDRIFGKNRWRSSSIISLAIGQGELVATPLQLANMECIFANRGYYYTPHLIKAIGDKKIIKPEFTVKHYAGIDAKYYEPVIDGMQQVVESGTAYLARIPGIVMCGKTGTVQNSRGKNHSVFVAFAPRDNPKIAIAVIVENAGYGSSYAAPIASYMIEKYLTDSISKPRSQVEWMMNQNLLPALSGTKTNASKSLLPNAVRDSLKKDSLRKATGSKISLNRNSSTGKPAASK